MYTQSCLFTLSDPRDLLISRACICPGSDDLPWSWWMSMLSTSRSSRLWSMERSKVSLSATTTISSGAGEIWQEGIHVHMHNYTQYMWYNIVYVQVRTCTCSIDIVHNWPTFLSCWMYTMYKIVDHSIPVYRYRWDRLEIATLPFYFLLNYNNKPQITTPYMYITIIITITWNFSRFIFYYQSQNLRGNHPTACSGKLNPSKRQSHLHVGA